ncbi:helix-turn-helix domain-containing protein [Myroides indicus]|nr:AraC family transcriptional regulator [Myroides indicus]
MYLYIKNMVCTRCKMAVEDIIHSLGYKLEKVELGEVEIGEELTSKQVEELNKKLQTLGFEILDNRKSQIVTKIKSILIDLVQNRDACLDVPLSIFITDNINQDYNTLSQLFSQLESLTIEQYFILLKIEKVKELLVYDELNLKEIAYRLNYSSVAHLSKQFKKTTGLTPTYFKATGSQRRKLIDKL